MKGEKHGEGTYFDRSGGRIQGIWFNGNRLS